MAMGWRIGLWAFLHPQQVIKAQEVEWLFQEVRLILTSSVADVRNPHLRSEDRAISVEKSKEMLKILDRLLK